MKIRGRKLIALLAVILCVFLSQQVLFCSATATATDEVDVEYLKTIIDTVRDRYKGELDSKMLVEAAVKGMLDTLDPYTTYFNSEETESFLNEIEGTFEGIGVGLEKRDDYIVIIKVFGSSPAEKAGILPGDKIVSANGKNMVGASVEEASSIIKGKANTKVTIGIIRSGKSEIIEFEITRAKVDISPVSYEIKDGICYLKIETFSVNTDKFVKQALREADKNGVSKVLLDLRNNPGGEVGQAVAVASEFVPEGLVTRLEFKSKDIVDREYWSDLEKQKYKVAVLVNGLSASASEIVAGAIQDTGAGTLIGTKTFGKAKVQSLIPLLTPEAYRKYAKELGKNVVDSYELIVKHGIYPRDDEIMGSIKITTGVYMTPKGRMIDEVGLTPDIIVDDSGLVNDIDINSLQKLSVTWKPGLNSVGIDVYNAKKILKVLGYNIETIDTFLDENTFHAISKFRIDRKLYPGGVLDFATQKALNAEMDKIILKYDQQYVKAIETLNSK